MMMDADYGHSFLHGHKRLVRDFSDEDAYLNGVPDTRAKSPSAQTPARSPLNAHPPDNGQWPMRNGDEFNHDPRGPGVLSPIEETSFYAPSAASISEQAHSISEQTSVSGSSGRLTDFFGIEVFQIVLHNPTTCHQLTKFAQTRFCGENMEFLEQVDRYNTLLNEMTKTMFDIHRNYISVNAPGQLNLGEHMLLKINKDLKSTLNTTFPKLESIFTSPQQEIETIVSSDIYPRFVRHQLTMSATKALAGNRTKYAGLGDCFVLTNPAIADNPIVYASDGFVKVTGYSRTDIIPRNCRFLQGRHTDRQSVRRIKMSVDAREESVELLLNYKKNGEPFWNLLYTAPLFNAEGNVAFFLGGQINCSTTIHSCSDILRILSTPQDVDEDSVPATVAPTTRKESWLKAFRNAINGEPKAAVPKSAGMENVLLNRIEKMNLKKQMDTFYTAYSKYLIINWETFFVAFYSAGIVDMLYPTKPNSGQIIGVDVFRFLGHHAHSLNRDFKSRVKAAMKVGAAVSVELSLCTRQYHGFEKFVTHWTPLKDEKGSVCFAVLTLGLVGA